MQSEKLASFFQVTLSANCKCDCTADYHQYCEYDEIDYKKRKPWFHKEKAFKSSEFRAFELIGRKFILKTRRKAFKNKNKQNCN